MISSIGYFQIYSRRTSRKFFEKFVISKIGGTKSSFKQKKSCSKFGPRLNLRRHSTGTFSAVQLFSRVHRGTLVKPCTVVKKLEKLVKLFEKRVCTCQLIIGVMFRDGQIVIIFTKKKRFSDILRAHYR